MRLNTRLSDLSPKLKKKNRVSTVSVSDDLDICNAIIIHLNVVFKESYDLTTD